jgi:4-amino-4-deoxy-L-arabinose transferase-like glycosyltransferase
LKINSKPGNTKNILNKDFRHYILLFVLCVPIFFINIKNSHDWGDDFAQYIYQAKNLVNSVPQSEPCYIYDNPNFVSPTYSIGFPIILAPVYYLFGNNIKAFSILITSILFILCFALFTFYRKHFTNLVSILLVLIFVYNPYTLNFKMEIMSDIPFALILLVTVLIYRRINKDKIISFILLGILAGLLVSVRSIGVALIIAIAFDRIILAIRFIKEKRGIKDKATKMFVKCFIQILVFLLISTGLFLLLNIIIFKVPGGGLLGYNHVFIFKDFFKTIIDNIAFYLSCFQNYFMSGVNTMSFITLLTQSLIITFTILGFFNKCIKKIELLELIILCYLFIIVIYPNKTLIIGMRYLFPLLPFLLYYTVQGIGLIKLDFNINKKIIALLLGFFILIPYTFSISNILKKRNEILQGPQEPESIETFDYIKNNTPPNSIFVFFRARILALYTGRKATYSWYWTTEHETVEQLDERFKKTGVNYILINSDLEDIGMDIYLKRYPEKVQLIWQNAKFKLYSYKSKPV